MNKKWCVWIIVFSVGISTPFASSAQDPITLIIKEGITKVIKAVDLKIQRLQNETIWLQNAQRVIENTLSQVKLDEISSWMERQRSLYQSYFEELWKVKSSISYYHRIREITEKQIRLVKEYKRAWTLLKKDKHFTAEELFYMEQVYTGILEESVKNLDQLFLVIHSFSTQMSDGKRLEIINRAANEVDQNYRDLTTFSQQNFILSLQRAQSEHEVKVMKELYGIQ